MYVERGSRRRCNARRQPGRAVSRNPSRFCDFSVARQEFLHYAFYACIAREHPAVQFERYCDDIIVHAPSERHALYLRDVIAKRLAECALELNEQKTHIVHCQNDNRRCSYEHTSFDFLSYTYARDVEEQVRELLRELLSGRCRARRRRD